MCFLQPQFKQGMQNPTAPGQRLGSRRDWGMQNKVQLARKFGYKSPSTFPEETFQLCEVNPLLLAVQRHPPDIVLSIHVDRFSYGKLTCLLIILLSLFCIH